MTAPRKFWARVYSGRVAHFIQPSFFSPDKYGYARCQMPTYMTKAGAVAIPGTPISMDAIYRKGVRALPRCRRCLRAIERGRG